MLIKFIFIFLIIFLYILIQYYIISYLKKAFPVFKKHPLLLKIIILSLCFLSIISEPLHRYYNLTFNNFNFNFLFYIGLSWLGISAISLTIFIIADFIKLVFKTIYKLKNFDINYSNFLRKYSKIIIFLILFISIFSMLNVSKGPIIKTIDISIKNLPVDNLSITQLSDLHLYPSTSKKTFDNIVNLTNFTNPDILVITGDVFDFDDIDFITKNFDFSKFKAKYGIFAITGNHEYYIKTENFFKIMKHFNIQVLDNRFQNVENIVNLIGIDDTENKKINQQKILTEINLQLDSNKNYSKLPKILLIHRPDIFDFASESGIDLQLSGHTHAGQIPPADIIEFIFFKYMVGLYSKNNKFNSKLYISPGTRFWGPPMRLFSKSEITKINLKKN